MECQPVQDLSMVRHVTQQILMHSQDDLRLSGSQFLLMGQFQYFLQVHKILFLLSLLTSGNVCSHYLSEYSKCAFSLLHFPPIGWVFHLESRSQSDKSYTTYKYLKIYSVVITRSEGSWNIELDYSCGNDALTKGYRQLNFLHA